MLVTLWLLAGVVFVLLTLAVRVIDHGRAQTAADAAALAAAQSPLATAVVVTANNGFLVAQQLLPDGVQVEVVVGGVRARARAVRTPSELPFHPSELSPSIEVHSGPGRVCQQLPPLHPVDSSPCQTTPTR